MTPREDLGGVLVTERGMPIRCVDQGFAMCIDLHFGVALMLGLVVASLIAAGLLMVLRVLYSKSPKWADVMALLFAAAPLSLPIVVAVNNGTKWVYSSLIFTVLLWLMVILLPVIAVFHARTKKDSRRHNRISRKLLITLSVVFVVASIGAIVLYVTS